MPVQLDVTTAGRLGPIIPNSSATATGIEFTTCFGEHFLAVNQHADVQPPRFSVSSNMEHDLLGPELARYRAIGYINYAQSRPALAVALSSRRIYIRGCLSVERCAFN